MRCLTFVWGLDRENGTQCSDIIYTPSFYSVAESKEVKVARTTTFHWFHKAFSVVSSSNSGSDDVLLSHLS